MPDCDREKKALGGECDEGNVTQKRERGTFSF